MTAIIPMFLPSVPSIRYLPSHDSGAVRDQTRQQANQHREVMDALKGLAKGRIAVTVRAGDVLPFVTRVVEQIEPLARDYDAASSRWCIRYRRVKDWQDKRKEARRNREREALVERTAREYRAKHHRWWRPVGIEQARKKAEEFVFWHRDYEDFCLYSSLSLGRTYKSQPKKPAGYDDLAIFRELRDAASISPDAVLNVPADVVAKLQRFA